MQASFSHYEFTRISPNYPELQREQLRISRLLKGQQFLAA
jgi:hypothetical protein